MAGRDARSGPFLPRAFFKSGAGGGDALSPSAASASGDVREGLSPVGVMVGEGFARSGSTHLC